MEDFQFLVGATHFDEEDGLLYFTMKVHVGKSPVAPVVLVSGAPIIKNSLLPKQYDETPLHVTDVIRMTGTVLEKRRQFHYRQTMVICWWLS